MARNMPRELLTDAKTNKRDEFYTQLCDIESELKHYEHQFAHKVIYCNCDDPRISNFFKYFFLNFERLQIKKLIASCFKPQSVNLFESIEPKQATYIECTSGGSDLSLIDNDIRYFTGDGDFRSPESIKLLTQADVVITNPPFSLFRESIAQLIKYKKQFLTIGNINAITYKEIFKLIQDNKT